MSITILTKNGVDNTNITEARAYNFAAGRKSGIVKGVLNECNFFITNNSSINIDTGELRLCGHRILIDEIISFTLVNLPSKKTKMSVIGSLVVEDSNPSFEIYLQETGETLTQQNLDSLVSGDGVYQVEIGRFDFNTNGDFTNATRTIEIITGQIETPVDQVANENSTNAVSNAAMVRYVNAHAGSGGSIDVSEFVTQDQLTEVIGELGGLLDELNGEVEE